ncbi:MAG: DNA polymerase III subunit delta [Myxococcota bacterium]
MKLSELLEELAKGRIRPAYLLAGDELLLRDDALAALRAAVLEGGAEDFNLQRLAGESTRPGELEDALRTLPVMAAHRLVVLRSPEKARGAGGKALLESLAEWVKGARPDATGVLVVTSERPDRRSRWVKAFADPAAEVDCKAPTDARSLARFLGEEAKRQGIALDAEAAGLLAERIGPQLLVLRQELAKASLLAGPGQPVERRHVEASTSVLAEQPIWDLTDAIGEGRVSEALGLLSRLQTGGAPAPVVLGTLAAHFRKLARVRSGGRVAGPPFVVRKLERQARRFSVARLRACLGAIHQADLSIKGASTLPPERELERLVLGLAG